MLPNLSQANTESAVVPVGLHGNTQNVIFQFKLEWCSPLKFHEGKQHSYLLSTYRHMMCQQYHKWFTDNAEMIDLHGSVLDSDIGLIEGVSEDLADDYTIIGISPQFTHCGT